MYSSHESALIAFSGGVDSSVVAALAKRAFGDATVAVTVDNGALHHGEVGIRLRSPTRSAFAT